MNRTFPLLALLTSSLALAGVSPAEIQESWAADAALRRSLGRYGAQLTGEDFATLARGDVVARIVRGQAGDRILGAVYTAAPLEAMWISVHDVAHRDSDDGVIYRELPGSFGTRQVLYTLADAPWPLEDRQSLVDIRFNRALYEQSEGRVWERTWTTADPALMRDPDPEALWMPTNEGSWQMVRVGGGALAVLSLRVHAGGSVPDEVGLRWGLMTLDSLLEGMAAFAEQMPSHYQGGHFAMARPDGTYIPLGSFTAAATP